MDSFRYSLGLTFICVRRRVSWSDMMHALSLMLFCRDTLLSATAGQGESGFVGNILFTILRFVIFFNV